MLAVICSGQGQQHADMFRLARSQPAAEPVFAAAARALGADPRDWLASTDLDGMRRNRAAQILCVTAALATHRIIRAVLPPRLIVLGYSVGQLAAWSIAGVLESDAALSLTARRAELMDRLGNERDRMAVVQGLARPSVETLAHRLGVELAIVNPGAVCIVAGPEDALKGFRDAALAAGARHFSWLPIFVASHTSRFAPAVPLLRTAIETARPVAPRAGITLLDGLNGALPRTLEEHVDALSRQIAATIQWSQCLEAAREHGATAFLELGPGRALADMLSRLFPDAPIRSVEDFAGADGIVQWLNGVVSAGR